METYVTIEKVAAMADLAVGTAYNLRAAGELPPPRFKRDGANFFAVGDIRFWLKNRKDGRKARRGMKRAR